MAKENVYNINVMRAALKTAWENGNRGLVTEKSCKELGISEGFFKAYENGMKLLYEAVSAYCRAKNSPSASADEIKATRERIFPLWKTMLACAEKEKFSRELRVREDDVANLVGFCQGFMLSKNDVCGAVSEVHEPARFCRRHTQRRKG